MKVKAYWFLSSFYTTNPSYRINAVSQSDSWRFPVLTGMSKTIIILGIHIAQMRPCAEEVWCSTKPHPLERFRAALPTQLLEKLLLHEWAFRRRMFLYTTQFQGPAMAATREQSCLKLMFVSLAIDQCIIRLQRSDLCWNRGYTNSNRFGSVVSLPE